MQAESPLTSIDLSQDGATLAVGSNRGKIYFYDLRQGATPVRIMAEHKASVQGLKFQKKFHKSVSGEPCLFVCFVKICKNFHYCQQSNEPSPFPFVQDSAANSKLRAATPTANKKTVFTGGATSSANSKPVPASNGVAYPHRSGKGIIVKFYGSHLFPFLRQGQLVGKKPSPQKPGFLRYGGGSINIL